MVLNLTTVTHIIQNRICNTKNDYLLFKCISSNSINPTNAKYHPVQNLKNCEAISQILRKITLLLLYDKNYNLFLFYINNLTL